jgi:hypothetical protein
VRRRFGFAWQHATTNQLKARFAQIGDLHFGTQPFAQPGHEVWFLTGSHLNRVAALGGAICSMISRSFSCDLTLPNPTKTTY